MSRIRRGFDGRSELRRFHRRQAREKMRRRFYEPWVLATISVGVQGEAEWRVRYLTGHDRRSLTSRLLGDPHWGRSALYGRLQQLQPTDEQIFQLTGGLAV